MIVIGLTGGIAAGKSSVSRELAARGARIIDGDMASRAVVRPGEPALEALVETFGTWILAPDGTMDRKVVGDRVFTDTDFRNRFDAIMDTYVTGKMESWLHQARVARVPVTVVDSALLYEAGWDKWCDGGVVWVDCDQEMRIARLMVRNTLTRAEALARIESQGDIMAHRNKSRWIVNNNGAWQDLTREIDRVWAGLVPKIPA